MFRSNQLVILVSSLFFSAFYNDLFWKKVADIYAFNSENIYYFISLFILLSTVIYIILSLVNFRYILKPALIVLFIVSASTSYFMNNYGIIVYDHMMEAKNLLSWKLALDIFIFGIIPSLVVYFINIEYKTFGKHLLIKFLSIIAALLIIVANLYLFGKFYTSFFKEHKSLRYYTNPTYYLYYSGKFVYDKYHNNDIIIQKSAK